MILDEVTDKILCTLSKNAPTQAGQPHPDYDWKWRYSFEQDGYILSWRKKKE